MKTRSLVKLGAVVVAVSMGLCGATLLVMLWDIHQDVQAYAAMAQEAHPHPGDDVKALIDYMNSDAHSLRERNHAVWALSQLGEPGALPALKAVYTGETCDHDAYLCQYELEKAIRSCGGTPTPPRQAKR